MNDENEIIAVNNIKNLIFTFRGLQLMIDKDCRSKVCNPFQIK